MIIDLLPVLICILAIHQVVKKSALTILILISSVALLTYGLGSCRKNDAQSSSTLMQQIPSGFPQPAYTFRIIYLQKTASNSGRKLFYDGILSIDGNISCASCHQQIAAFGTFDHDRSHGYRGSHTLRNAPVLFNLAWQPKFHWDGEFNSLFDEAAQPINGHIEMAESFRGVINKLQRDAVYGKCSETLFIAMLSGRNLFWMH